MLVGQKGVLRLADKRVPAALCMWQSTHAREVNGSSLHHAKDEGDDGVRALHRWQSIFSGRGDPAHARPPRGLYMWGGVGTGKTMLMDLLAASAPPEFRVRPAHQKPRQLPSLHSVRGVAACAAMTRHPNKPNCCSFRPRRDDSWTHV